MKIKICSNIDDVAEKDWNALVRDNNPFLKHAWLAALEHHNCVGEEFGWLPRHIVIYEEESDGLTLVAAMPLYEKYNSYGEFVFDNAWADAYQRYGLRYFPKLVSAIPYSPVSGQRLLALPNKEAYYFPILLDTVKQLADSLNVSSYHCLFPLSGELEWLKTNKLLIRHDCQFHWQNHQYSTFDDFLAELSAKKRKNIRQERNKVNNAGVALRVLDGYTSTEKDWEYFAHFYNRTFEEKWGTATLNVGFFKEVAEKLPEQIVLVLADDVDKKCIAGSLMYRSDRVLYGRHWGCVESIDSLHFEACYYQGIEYCIQHGIQTFEPGAQGEHKIARGFVPTLTRSAHWLRDQTFQVAISQYVRHEQEAVQEYIKDSIQRLPYKNYPENFDETLL